MDHPDYKYQPRRKKIKTMGGNGSGNVSMDEKSPQQHHNNSNNNSSSNGNQHVPRKAGRRSKKHMENEMEMEDNDSDKSEYTDVCMNYGSNYDNRTSLAQNYSAFSSYLPLVTPPSSSSTLSSAVADLGNTLSSAAYHASSYNDFYASPQTMSSSASRKYECQTTAAPSSTSSLSSVAAALMQNKVVNSPHSSVDEHSMTPPESSICAASANNIGTATTAASGNYREMSPSHITSHAIMKEDYGASSDCLYRAPGILSPTSSSSSTTADTNNKDFNLISKYNHESYRIFSTHTHHHFYYSPTSSSHGNNNSTSGSINYPYHQSYPTAAATSAGGIDTDIDVEEMEQYLDSGKYRKVCYMKPENSLTELTPMLSVPSPENYNSHHLHHNSQSHPLPLQHHNSHQGVNNGKGVENESLLAQMPLMESSHVANEVYGSNSNNNNSNNNNNYQETSASSSTSYPSYGMNGSGNINNWVNYGI
jgi:hypothetical protein